MLINRLKSGLQSIALAALAIAATPAAAQLFITQPDFKPAPIEGSDPLVGIAIPGATPAEYRAHLLWNLRAGLNVAALQCQFSPYLRSVDNYNGILAHHAKELAEAYTDLNGYFRRVQGSAAKGQKAFDDYTTNTYQGFSTFYAQMGFCQTASDIAKEALTRPKGQLYLTGQTRMRELRNSLTPAYDRVGVYNPYLIHQPVLPPLDEKCWDRKDRLRERCGGKD